MATQAQLVETVKNQAESLNALIAGLDKVGTEMDSVLKEVQDLKDVIANGQAGDVSPELQQAVDDVSTAVASLKTHVQAVDDKVPDPVPSNS